MASIEQAIFSKLSSNAPLIAVVPATRIYHVLLADNTIFPAISYQRISTTKGYTLTEVMNLTEANFQIDSWGNTDLEALEVGDLVRTAIDGFRGVVEGVTIERIFQINEYTMPDMDGAVGRRNHTYRVIFQQQ